MSFSARRGSQVGWSGEFCVALSGLFLLSGFFAGLGASGDFEDDSDGWSCATSRAGEINRQAVIAASIQLIGRVCFIVRTPGALLCPIRSSMMEVVWQEERFGPAHNRALLKSRHGENRPLITENCDGSASKSRQPPGKRRRVFVQRRRRGGAVRGQGALVA